jgi:protein-S-isoprenylcysteine O-methyltransferase Ste14
LKSGFSGNDRRQAERAAPGIGERRGRMRIGASLFLIAVGAILKFAVTDSVSGINVGVVGIVLMIVGIVGLLLEAIMMGTRRRRDVIVHEDPYVERTASRAPPRY